MKRPGRHGFLMATLAIGLLLAGCPRQTPVPNESPKAAPRLGGNAIVGGSEEPRILNSTLIGGDLPATRMVVNMLNRGAFQATPDLGFKPYLVTRIPSVENGDVKVTGDKMSVTFRIRKEARWSDGRDVTSSDFKFTAETLGDPNNRIQPRLRTGFDLIESMDSTRPKVFEVNFKSRYNQWMLLFTGNGGVLPEHALEGKDFNSVLNDGWTVTNGPFVFKEWRKGESITLARNENFWGPHKAYLESVTFKYFADVAALNNAFRSRDVIFIQPEPEVALLDEIESFPGVVVNIGPGTVWEHLAFHHGNGLEKKEVREAIAYSIDREALIPQSVTGKVKPLQSFVLPQIERFASMPWAKYNKDVNKAKQLMTKAGYGPSNPLQLKISSTAGNKTREDNEASFQAQLKEIYIELTIENFPASAYFRDVLPRGGFQIGEWAWLSSPGYAGASNLVDLFAPDQIPTEANSFEGQNYYRYLNPKIGQLNERLKATLDEGDGAKLIKQVAQLMADDVAILPLYQRLDPIAYFEFLHGPKNNPTEEGPLWNVEDWWMDI